MPKKDPKENLRPFKPGQSGNPGGRPKLPDDIKEARKLNQVELERIVNKYLYMDREAVKAAISSPKTPMMELMVASIVAQAAQKGDHLRLDFVLNRMIGKVKDEKDHNHNFNVSLRGMPREDVIEIGKDALRYLQDGDGDAD